MVTWPHSSPMRIGSDEKVRAYGIPRCAIWPPEGSLLTVQEVDDPREWDNAAFRFHDTHRGLLSVQSMPPTHLLRLQR